jgi:hypothetical protein
MLSYFILLLLIIIIIIIIIATATTIIIKWHILHAQLKNLQVPQNRRT